MIESAAIGDKVSREPPRIGRQNRITGARSTLLLLFGVLVASRVFAAFARSYIAPISNDSIYYSLIMIGQTLVFYGLPAGLYYFAFPRHAGQWRKQMAVPKKSFLLLALGAGALHQLALQLVTLIWGQGLLSLGVPLRSAGIPIPTNGAQASLLFLAIAIMPAICEESLFRGVLYPGLCREFSKRQSIGLACLIFALMHGSLYGLPAHLAVSFMLTAMCAGQGSLPLCMVYHLSYNGISLLTTLLDQNGIVMRFLSANPSLLFALCGLMMLLSILAAIPLIRPFPKKEQAAPSGGTSGGTWMMALLLISLLLLTYLLEFLPI